MSTALPLLTAPRLAPRASICPRIVRRLSLGLVLLVLSALFSACGSETTPVEEPDSPSTDIAKRPNVVLLVLDTLRRDHITPYGSATDTTPRLAALAEQGVVFEDCLAQSSWTLPSMISLMTGHPLFSNLYRVPEQMPMLGEAFHEAGYRTASFVANSLVGAEAGFERGFELSRIRPKGGPAWPGAQLVDEAESFLEEQAESDAPFLLWVHFLDTHAPYTPANKPPKLPPEEVFEDVDLRTIESVLAALPEDDAKRLRFQVSAVAREVQFYDAELRELDAQIGRLLDRLETLDLTRETYIAVVADHGEGLFRRPQHPDRLEVLRNWREGRGEPLRLTDRLKMEHDGWLYDELVATPWILVGPGLSAERRVPELVTNMDVFPTLAGLCGLPAVRASGRDLSRALLSGQPVAAAEFAVTACSGSMAARLPNGRKLILPDASVRARLGLAEELFDRAADPFEERPLPLDEEALSLRARLLKAAEDDPFRAFYDAPDEATLVGLRELGYVR